MYPYLITTNSVTLVADTKVLSMVSTHPDFPSVLSHIKKGNWDEAVALLSPREAIREWASDSDITVSDAVYYRGKPLDHAVVPHILKMRQEGFDVGPLVHFLEKLLANPSMRSRDQLWRFVQSNAITITPQGDLLLYKKVTRDLWDVHTGSTNRYTLGSTHTMPRHLVDDDPEKTCSHGLHVCSLEYLQHFGGARLLLVEVDPADVVAVPIDYKDSKLRVCRLTVVKELHDGLVMRSVEEPNDELPF